MTTDGRHRQLPYATRLKRRAGMFTLAPYGFVAPFFLLFAVFMLIPTGFGLWVSLHDWSGFGDPTWIGLANYERLLADSRFFAAVVNTLWYVGASVLIVCPLALVLASGLNQKGVRARDMFRTGFFVPVVLSPIVVSIIFILIFDREFGLANAVIRGGLGLPPIDWLGSPGWAKIAIILTLVWRWTGYVMIYFLAGLQNVPKELYEAAETDGASPLRQFWHVTLPSLNPVIAFVAITVVIGAAQIYEEPYLLTQGGPGDATISVTMFIYRAGFERTQMGYAAAAGVISFVAVFVVTRILFSVFGIGKEHQ